MTALLPNGHDVTAANPYAQTSGAERRTLDAIFRHPLAHNLSLREVVSLFAAMGGAEEKHTGDFVFRAGADTLSMKRPHHKDLSGQDVMDLRRFLEGAGWSPDAAPSPEHGARGAPSGLIVAIDHAGAKIYRIDPSADAGGDAVPGDERRLLHHLNRKGHDHDREETSPEDERFFEEVAHALSGGGAIVVIGHGKGQSNEAAHLTAHLQAHHKDIHARIVREIAADLPHLTTPELIALGRTGFDPV